jgi:hypothetical protein
MAARDEAGPRAHPRPHAIPLKRIHGGCALGLDETLGELEVWITGLLFT